ncbi:CYTH and CHAD domain-containing protein [Arthrobacter sp. Leaf141]|uniref:CYTH and CHAD domain-containing protein n=1 Tax=Arthrobacter sp. Leaf141 TaxID=1736273 RepID=UPI001F451969|nr:CYTH and CHAD domain-containing protein [Arthrobacter sp. Leaf141]
MAVKASQGLEVEKKYDVGEEAGVPDLSGLPGVARVGDPHEALLEAVYFDTADHALAARRITLRRRTGGADAGWHLKLPPAIADAAAVSAAPGDAPQVRQELHAPLGQPDVVPDSLLAHLQVHLRGAEVAPVARLATRRTTHTLYAADGLHLADLADDRVTAGKLPGDGADQQWREWEFELVHGSADLFGPAGELLAAAGAAPSGHASKLVRALGGKKLKSRHLDSTPVLLAGKKAPAAAVVTVYVATQLGQLVALDPAVRLEEPDAVHDMRTATRRLRSVLAAYRKLYSAVQVRRLQSELKWLAAQLGAPRDAEVMAGLLQEPLAALPAGNGADTVRQRISQHTGTSFDAGYRTLLGALGSARYFRLLDDLEAFRDNPPVRTGPVAAGKKVTAKAVDKSAARLRRAHKAAAHARRGTDHHRALHQIRKDAKRLRHVAESAVPVHGKRAGKVARAAHSQQKFLGAFNDAVLARELLASLVQAADQPDTAAALAALISGQEEQMAASVAGYRKARKKSKDLLNRGVI